MKKLFFLSLLVLGLASQVNAADCVMFSGHPEACSLNSNQSARVIEVHYPRHIFCKLRLVTNSPAVSSEALDRLADNLLVELEDGYLSKTLQLNPVVKVTEGVIEYELGVNTLYMTNVTISTIFGVSLNNMIKSVFQDTQKNVSLAAIPVACHKD